MLIQWIAQDLNGDEGLLKLKRAHSHGNLIEQANEIAIIEQKYKTGSH